MAKKTYTIRATPISFGGIILSGLALVMLALTWIAFQPAELSLWLRVFMAVITSCLILYAIDAASEWLRLENDLLVFDSILRKKIRVDVCAMEDVLIVHEGLNTERGIVSVRFRESTGQVIRIALGPMWRREELEDFFRDLEKRVGSCKLVEEVR